MVTSKFGLNQLKFNKGSKIYAKGDKATLHTMFIPVR